MNISELFISAARKYPNKIALQEKNNAITFAELEREVIATASYFTSKGIGEGDRVLVFIPMSIDVYRVVLALFYLGATAVFIDEWVSMERLNLCCSIADCKGIICIFKAKIYALFSKELRNVPVKLSMRKRGKTRIEMRHVSPETPALITFTTGSTGIPKAANRTHDFLYKQFIALLGEMKPSSDDICMCSLPIIPFINLGVGVTTVILTSKLSNPSLRSKIALAEELRKSNVTTLIVSPNLLKQLSMQLLQSKRSLPHLSRIFTGGAPVFPHEAEIYAAAFQSTEVTIFYGSTEAEPISSIGIHELRARKHELTRGLPVGSIYEKAAVKIIRITDQPLPRLTEEEFTQHLMSDGVIGEIIVSGEHVLKNYFKNPEAYSQNKITVGTDVWHRTSDSGFIIGNQLFLTGRCKQIIHRNSMTILPFLIENKLQAIDGIELGTILEINKRLTVIVQSTLSHSQIERYITDLPAHTLIILPKIPVDKRHNSKIDYEALRHLIERK